MSLKLINHPDFPTNAVDSILVDPVWLGEGRFRFRYEIRANVELLSIPKPVKSACADGLWKTTCVEAFVGATGNPGYLEMNFSPSTCWAAYLFEDYRGGMKNLAPAAIPDIERSRSDGKLEIAVSLDLDGLSMLQAEELEMAVTAVIEEKSGRKSYWALAHPSGSPDFHNRDCFIHRLKVTESP